MPDSTEPQHSEASPPKSAWALSSGSYSDYSVAAVFATKELAEEAAAAANRSLGQYSDSYEVEEFPYFDRSPLVRTRYERALFSDGRVTTTEESVPEWNGWGEEIQGWTWDHPYRTDYTFAVVRVLGYDKERVDKAFSDRVAEYHARKPVGE